MQKKWISGVVAGVLGTLVIVGAVILNSGCTDDQIRSIVKNAGIYSAIMWVAVDNPSSNQLQKVAVVVDAISSSASGLGAGKTCMEALSSGINKIIDDSVSDTGDRVMCKAAAVTVLNGIDMIFIFHPNWKSTPEKTCTVIVAFCDGAKSALSLDEKHPAMIEARSAAKARSMILENK